MRPAGNPRQLERRRRFAISLLEDGLAPAEVATRVGVNRRSVCRWKAEYHRRGEAGIRAKPAPGRPAKLRREEQRLLVTMLMQGAQPAGFATDFWTSRRVAALIWQSFGVRYHIDHIGRLLRSLAWNPQRPLRLGESGAESGPRVQSEAAGEAWSTTARAGAGS